MDSPIDSLLWIEELLPHDMQMIPKYGGQAYYLDEHLMLILVERPGRHYEYEGTTYPFDLWKGVLFVVEKKKQNAFFLKYLFLENHPANKNWLYIPADSENFEEEVKQMLQEVHRRNVLLGIPIKLGSLGKKKKTLPKTTEKSPPKTKSKSNKTKENAFLLAMAKRQRR